LWVGGSHWMAWFMRLIARLGMVSKSFRRLWRLTSFRRSAPAHGGTAIHESFKPGKPHGKYQSAPSSTTSSLAFGLFVPPPRGPFTRSLGVYRLDADSSHCIGRAAAKQGEGVGARQRLHPARSGGSERFASGVGRFSQTRRSRVDVAGLTSGFDAG
jgi:hypothetical protein